MMRLGLDGLADASREGCCQSNELNHKHREENSHTA